MTASQLNRLSPAVADAMAADSTPSLLVPFTRANIDCIRSPYAVLAARLSPTELPSRHRLISPCLADMRDASLPARSPAPTGPQ